MTESRTRTDVSSHGNVAREVPAEPEVTARSAGATRDVRAEPMIRETEQQNGPTQFSIAPSRRDRVRWGPVWAGLIVALPTFLLFQLLTLWAGWWDIGQADSNGGWISGLVGLAAFFLGGLTAGASIMWRSVSDGLLHGILVWALGVVAILVTSVLGGGALLGSLADITGQASAVQRANLDSVQAGAVADTLRTSAGWAVLGLGLAIIAAGLGGVLGVKTWPRKKDAEERRAAAR